MSRRIAISGVRGTAIHDTGELLAADAKHERTLRNAESQRFQAVVTHGQARIGWVLHRHVDRSTSETPSSAKRKTIRQLADTPTAQCPTKIAFQAMKSEPGKFMSCGWAASSRRASIRSILPTMVGDLTQLRGKIIVM